MKKSLLIIAALAAAAVCAVAQAADFANVFAHALPAFADPGAAHALAQFSNGDFATASALAGLGAFGTTKAYQDGCIIDWVNGTGAAVSSNSVVRIGSILGIALVDIANGATGSVCIHGVFSVPKVSGAVIAQGESLTWDASAAAFDDNAAVPAAGDVTGAAAVAFEAAGNGVTTLHVMFTGVPGTVA